MEDRRDKQIVQQVFETSLSGLQEDPWLAQRVLSAARKKGEGKVKKKISASLILVIVLMLVTLTALAIGLGIDEIWRNSFEKMNTTGEIQTISYPEEGDMTAEEAIEIARNAITAMYGTTEEEFSRMGVYPTFLAHGYDEEAPDDPAEWRIFFSSRQDVNIDLDTTDYGPDGEYKVYLNAETREILFCNWYTNDFWSRAQRIWDCGSHDEVYWQYNQPEFYHQSAEAQAYWTQMLRDRGYDVREENGKYHDLLLAADTDLKFSAPDRFLPEEDAQAAAAWEALHEAYGLDIDLMKQYAFGATRPGWETGTEDICVNFQYEDQFMRVEQGEISGLVNWIFESGQRLGLFMVSFEPGTTQVKEITHLLHSESMRYESVTSGRLLEKTDWTADDLVAFDAAMAQLHRAVKRMEAAGCTGAEQEIAVKDFINRLGGNPEYYPAAPEGTDAARWFREESPYDALIEEVELTPAEARKLYGRDTRFWPLDVQAALLSTFSAPRPGELTAEGAAQLAVQAVIDQKGQSALDKLGDYTVGFQLYRFENGGEVTRWHVFITDDPGNAQNGWQVIIAFRDGEMWGPIDVYDIASGGVG